MKNFKSITGLKGIAILLIVLVHTMANGNFSIENQTVYHGINKMSVVIELCFMLSAFGMCCGYYNKIKNGEIDLNKFYSRRYKKILPFFAIIILAEVVVSGASSQVLKEAFLDLTLLFSFLPKGNIEVVGIGWTLGVIFAFYILFPFFVFLLWNKKRAWFTLICAEIIKVTCGYFFLNDGEIVNVNFMLWSTYFIIGGIIFLYKDLIIKNISRPRFLLLGIASLGIGFDIFNLYQWNNLRLDELLMIVVFVVIIAYAITGKSFLLDNKVSQIIGKHCLEIYLSHMMVFRVIEKMPIKSFMGNGYLALSCTYILTCIATIAFSICASSIISKIGKMINEKN